MLLPREGACNYQVLPRGQSCSILLCAVCRNLSMAGMTRESELLAS